jgi:hypothetical protein
MLALTSPARGGRSIGIVRSRTKPKEFSLVSSYTETACPVPMSWRLAEAQDSEHEVLGSFVVPLLLARVIQFGSSKSEHV